MATPKKTSKKAATGYRKSKGFNLNIKNDAQALELVTHLEMLKASAGWQLMVQILEGNMAILERMIVTKQDPETKATLDEKTCDELRIKRNYLEELLEKPDKLIAQFSKKEQVGIPTYDPYAADPRQLRKGGSDVGAPMAHVLGDEE